MSFPFQEDCSSKPPRPFCCCQLNNYLNKYLSRLNFTQPFVPNANIECTLLFFWADLNLAIHELFQNVPEWIRAQWSSSHCSSLFAPICLTVAFHQGIHNLSLKVQTTFCALVCAVHVYCKSVQNVCVCVGACVCTYAAQLFYAPPTAFWLAGPQQEIVCKWVWPHVINLWNGSVI